MKNKTQTRREPARYKACDIPVIKEMKRPLGPGKYVELLEDIENLIGKEVDEALEESFPFTSGELSELHLGLCERRDRLMNDEKILYGSNTRFPDRAIKFMQELSDKLDGLYGLARIQTDKLAEGEGGKEPQR